MTIKPSTTADTPRKRIQQRPRRSQAGSRLSGSDVLERFRANHEDRWWAVIVRNGGASLAAYAELLRARSAATATDLEDAHTEIRFLLAALELGVILMAD